MGVGGWVDGLVNGWVRSKIYPMTKNLINLDLIEVIQFCLKIYDCRDTPPTHPPMAGCVGGWVVQSMGSGQMTNN